MKAVGSFETSGSAPQRHTVTHEIREPHSNPPLHPSSRYADAKPPSAHAATGPK